MYVCMYVHVCCMYVGIPRYVNLCMMYVICMYVKAVGNKGVIGDDKMSFRARAKLAVLEAGRSIPSTRCPQSFLGSTLMRVRSWPVDVNKSTSEGSLSRSARRPCSEAEGRRASAPRVSRQVLNHGRTGPWIPSHLLETGGRSLRQNALDVVRSQFVKFVKDRCNAGVGEVDLTCTSKNAFPAPERSDWLSRETKTAYRKRISGPARGGHCSALAARAGAGTKYPGLRSSLDDNLPTRRARTPERNQGGPERRTDIGFFRGERTDRLLGR